MSALSHENPIGVHALVFAGDWSTESCERAVSGARAAGFDMIEVPMFNPAAVNTTITRDVLAAHGVVASTSLGLPADADIASEDGEVVERGVQLLLQALQKSADIDATYMVGVIASALRKYPGPCTPGARKNVVASLRRVADAAADVGVTLGLEVVNRYESNVMNTAAEAMGLISEIGRDNVAVHLDTYHMNIEEVSMADAVRTCGSWLGYVHIGESHRGYLGTGSVDFRGLFRELVAANYTGPITFESFSSAVVSPDLSNNLCVWRNLWNNSDDLASHACMFIESELHAARRADWM